MLIVKDIKSNDFVSADSARLTARNSVCAHSKGVASVGMGKGARLERRYCAARAARSLLSGNRQSPWRALQSMYTASRRALGSSSSHFLSGERPHPSSTASTIGFGSLRHSAAGWLRWMHSSGRLPAQHDFLGKRTGGPSECQAEIKGSGGVWIDFLRGLM